MSGDETFNYDVDGKGSDGVSVNTLATSEKKSKGMIRKQSGSIQKHSVSIQPTVITVAAIANSGFGKLAGGALIILATFKGLDSMRPETKMMETNTQILESSLKAVEKQMQQNNKTVSEIQDMVKHTTRPNINVGLINAGGGSNQPAFPQQSQPIPVASQPVQTSDPAQFVNPTLLTQFRSYDQQTIQEWIGFCQETGGVGYTEQDQQICNVINVIRSEQGIY